MKKISFTTIFSIATALVGGIFLYLAIFDVGFWDPVKGPLGGFYPALASCVLIPVCLVSAVQSLKQESSPFNRDDLKVALGAGVTIALFKVIGMIASIALFLFLWVRIVEKRSWLFCAKFTVIIAGIAWLVFDFWLNVKFPTGMIFDLLLG